MTNNSTQKIAAKQFAQDWSGKGEKRAFKASVDSSNDKMEWTGPDGAVREFNGYPEYCLACAGYLGMAVAHLWDKDWAKYMDTPYDFFQSERGFDDMDDYITGNILRESKHSVAAMHSLSAEAYHFLMKSGAEAGTAEAYRFFLISVEVMYKMGAAIWLNRLGYKFEKVNLV